MIVLSLSGVRPCIDKLWMCIYMVNIQFRYVFFMLYILYMYVIRRTLWRSDIYLGCHKSIAIECSYMLISVCPAYYTAWLDIMSRALFAILLQRVSPNCFPHAYLLVLYPVFFSVHCFYLLRLEMSGLSVLKLFLLYHHGIHKIIQTIVVRNSEK